MTESEQSETDGAQENSDHPHEGKALWNGSRRPYSGPAADLWDLTDEEVAEIFDEEEP